jgi:plastocyanin
MALGAVLLSALLVSGCGGGGGGGDSARYHEPKGPATETISIKAGNFFFEPDAVTAQPGIAEIKLVGSAGDHTLVFDHGKAPGFFLEVEGDGTASEKIDLTPGKYVFYCNIIGHRAQGMEGTITVK